MATIWPLYVCAVFFVVSAALLPFFVDFKKEYICSNDILFMANTC